MRSFMLGAMRMAGLTFAAHADAIKPASVKDAGDKFERIGMTNVEEIHFLQPLVKRQRSPLKLVAR